MKYSIICTFLLPISASDISRFLLVNSNGRLLQVPLSVSYKTDIMIQSEGNKDILAFDVDVRHRYSVKFIVLNINYYVNFLPTKMLFRLQTNLVSFQETKIALSQNRKCFHVCRQQNSDIQLGCRESSLRA